MRIRRLHETLAALIGACFLAAGCATPNGGSDVDSAPAAAPATRKVSGGPEVSAPAPGSLQVVKEPCRDAEARAAGDAPGSPQIEVGLSGDYDSKTGAVTKGRPYAAHRCR